VEARARFEARHGEGNEALRILDAYEKVVPNHPSISAMRASLEAGERIAPLISAPGDGAGQALITLGMALARDGGEDLSVLYLQMAHDLLPEDTLTLAALADVFERQEKYEDAIAAYLEIPEGSPLRRSADVKRALNLNSIEKNDEAIALLEALIADVPDDLEAITALGNILRSDEQFEEAARVYSKAIDLIGTPTRQHWTLFYFRGIAHERSKQWPKAEVDLQKALELEPDHPLVLNYLGYSWVDQGIYLDEGLEMIEKAVQRRPRDGYIVDSLGWVFYRLGRYEEAVVQLERAVELRPDDPIINDHLGDAYWKVGRRLEAMFQWSHALDLDPEPDERLKIEAKMETGLPEPEVEQADAAQNGASGADEAPAAQ